MSNNVRLISSAPQSPKGVTRAESEVLDLLAEGKRNAEIAEIRGVSVWTVKGQMGSAMAKLKANGRVDAAVRWSELKRAA